MQWIGVSKWLFQLFWCDSGNGVLLKMRSIDACGQWILLISITDKNTSGQEAESIGSVADYFCHMQLSIV